MIQDVSSALRTLVRAPGFTVVAFGTLALGLSTSSAVFTYVHAYARPFPGVDADDLLSVWFATEDERWGAMSVPDFRDVSAQAAPELAVTGVGSSFFLASVRHERLAEVAVGEAVAGDFFSLLGVDMSIGRALSVSDDRPGAELVTVIGHGYWQSRYGGDPGVVGRTIVLNGEPYTIVGVVGPEYLGASSATRPQFWLPLEQFLRVYRPGPETHLDREPGAILPIARLADGVSAERAQSLLSALAVGLDADAPLSDRSRRFLLSPTTWISPETRDQEASTTRVMLVAAGLMLVLTCANVANMLLSAGSRRSSEMTIRAALGASRWRLARQLFVESLVLSVPAGISATLLAGPLSARLSSYFARPSVWGADVAREVSVDPAVVLLTLSASVVTGALTGLAPVLRVFTRSSPLTPDERGSAVFQGGRGFGFGTRDLLVSSQVAISVVLLFVAALVLRTLQSASDIDPGFDTEQTMASYVSTSSMGVPISDRHRFFAELIRRFEELPWVGAATVAENAPLSGHPSARLSPADGTEPVDATVARVWTEYFHVMGFELLRGRTFLPTDTAGAAGVVVVNESLARRISADAGAVGRTLVWPGGADEPDQVFEVVGVVGDARQEVLLEAPGPVAYFALLQQYSRPGNALLLEVRGDPDASVEAVRRELRAVDAHLAIVNVLSYRDVLRGALYVQRMNAELFAAMAMLALLLSATGVFAVAGLAVAERRRDTGIRIALGADGASIAWSVLAPMGISVLIGLSVGLAGAFVATRWVGGLLWGVAPMDPVAMGTGVVVLLATVAGAVAVPLRRALAVDPVVSLRSE